jgi:hypothetical protein
MALAPRTRTPTQVFETDGYRHYTVRRFGLFPVVKTERVPNLNVSQMTKAELARLGLKLPPKGTTLLYQTQHSYAPGNERYWLSGPYPGSPKDAYNDFRAWFVSCRRLTNPQLEQVTGKCADKRTNLLFQATDDGHGKTYLNIGLDHPWQGTLPSLPR